MLNLTIIFSVAVNHALYSSKIEIAIRDFDELWKGMYILNKPILCDVVEYTQLTLVKMFIDFEL